jgi:putative ABC transport system permease protein
METLLRNIGYSIRSLARTPGFTLTVVLTLALGIGANSAVFSAIDAVLLQSLPFPDADRLVLVTQTEERSNASGTSPVRLEDWNELSSSFEAITGYSIEDSSETTGEYPERVRKAEVAPRFLDVWGTSPALGRGFTPDEYVPGGTRAVLISDRYWRNRFAADPAVLTRTLRLNGQPYAIVGVMPPGFLFPDRGVDIWNPDWSLSTIDPPQQRYLVWYTGIARLKPGVTIEQARADLGLVQARLAEEFPDTDRGIGVQIAPLKDAIVAGTSSSLWLLFGAVSLLLLIACTNIAALLLSRAARREQEVAVRISLGASRAAIGVQLLTESAVLAFAGAALGLLVAVGASAVFRAIAPDLPRLNEIGVDVRILAYTVCAAVVVALACGVLPAVRGAREGSLSRSSRGQVVARHSLQWLLVGVQVALSVALLTGAGLLLRSFEALSRVDPGFDPSQVLAFRISADWAEGQDYEGVIARINGTIDALNTVPGVEATATAAWLPGVPGENLTEVEIEQGRADSEPRVLVERRSVSPGYFEAMSIPLLAGELCDLPADRSSARQVMVSRGFATRYFADRPLVGLQLAFNTPPDMLRIAGVVGDARDRGMDREPVPTVYNCFSAPTVFPWFLVRTSGDPRTAFGSIRERIKEIEPLRSVYEMALLEERIGDAYSQNRLRTFLSTLFAVTALLLACLGVYGTLNYVVSLRRREVSLRIALGALARNIVSQFLLKALRVIAIACVAGLALSFAFARALTGMLYGVSPSDPATLSGVVIIVMAVGVLAALLPAVRAARVDPMQVLREE